MGRRFALLTVFGVLASVLAVSPVEAMPAGAEAQSAAVGDLGGFASGNVEAVAAGSPMMLGARGFQSQPDLPEVAAVDLESVGERSRGVPPALVPTQSVVFDADGSVVPTGGEQSALGAGVRLVRPDGDRESSVVLSTLDAVPAASVSSLGFGFALDIDGAPGAAASGRPPVVPARGRDGVLPDAALGERSGWSLEFDLALFADVLADVGRVQFEVGLGCSDSGCRHTQLLPSTVDFERSVVVVDVPVNVLAAVSRGSRPDNADRDTDADNPGSNPETVESTTTTSTNDTTTSEQTTTTEGNSEGQVSTTSQETTTVVDPDSETTTTTGSGSEPDSADGASSSLVEGTRTGAGGGGAAGSGLVGVGVRPSLRAVVMQGSGSGVYFGASGAASGPQGDYSASQLKGLSSWQVGLHTGSAELSYEVPVPGPVWGGMSRRSGFRIRRGRLTG